MKRLIFLLYVYVIGISGIAQTVPAERIFFCSDNAVYNWDDSLYINGIVMNTDTMKLPESHYAYVDAFNAQDSLCLHVRLRCMPDGSFSLRVPANALGGVGRFYCRAYTRLMLNDPLEAIPLITILISDESTTQSRWNCSADLSQFDLQEAFQGNSDTVFKAEKSLEISGIARYRIDKRPVKNGSVMAYQRSNQKVYTASTDRYGHFCIPVDDFFTGEEFYLQAYDKRDNEYPCDFNLDEPFIPPFHHQETDVESADETSAQMGIQRGGIHQTNMLPGITVHARQKRYSHERERKEFYRTRLLTHDDIMNHNMTDINAIIQHFSHLMMMAEDAATHEKILVSKRLSVISSGKTKRPSSIKIVVDGTECTLNQLESMLSCNDIEEVEYLSPTESLGVRGVRFALDGALVIKTMHGHSKSSRVGSNGQIFVLKGIDDLQ